MSQDPSFAELMARLKAGEAEAATRIFNTFAGRLVRLARRRMAGILRPKVDPEDVIQSVFRSFFARQAEGQFDLRSWPELWSLLVVLTFRKCGGRLDYFFAARRDIRQEVAPRAAAEDSASSWQAMAREPTPSEVVAFTELLEQLMEGLEERERRIVSLSLEGHSTLDIKAEVGCSERTVFRVLGQVKKRLRRLLMDSSSVD